MYYLNKSLHGFDCSYSTKLPDIFLIFHGVGTVLGKASYSDYFVSLQGCTIGSHRGAYPVLGKGVALAAGSSVIGACELGSGVSVSANTHVYNLDVNANKVVYYDYHAGNLVTKKSVNSYAQDFFNIDIKSLWNAMWELVPS